MSLRSLKTIEIGLYLSAAIVASFFRVQPIPNQPDWSLVRDLVEVLIIPYALFVIIGLIAYWSSRRMVVGILCLVVSFVVCVYTLFTYVRVFVVWGSDPKATNVFFSTPLVLLVGGLGIFVVGGLGIGVLSRTKVLQRRAEQALGADSPESSF